MFIRVEIEDKINATSPIFKAFPALEFASR